MTSQTPSADDKPENQDAFLFRARHGDSIEQWLNALDNAETHFSSTDMQLGGTITALDRIEKNVSDLQRQIYQASPPNLDGRVRALVEPIRQELSTAKSQLAETRSSVSNLAGFIAENREALTTLVSVSGKMTAIESQMTSVLGRVTKLETDKTASWNKTATTISIIVALLSLGAAIYFALT